MPNKMRDRDGGPCRRHGCGGQGGRGFWGRFLGPTKHAFHKGKVLTSDELQLVVLKLLSEKPSYGYEVIKRIEEHASGIYSPSPGMIYPALTYLEEVGYAIPKMDGTKKLFDITSEGQGYLKDNHETLVVIMDQLKAYGEKMAYFQDQMTQDERVEERWGGHMRGHCGEDWRELKTEFQQLRHDLKSALYEKVTAPMEEKKRVLSVLRKAIAEIRG